MINDQPCPTADALEQAKNATRNGIRSLLKNTVVPELNRQGGCTCYNSGNCTCGKAGKWTQVARINMSLLNQQCPTGWSLVTTPIQGCSRTSSCSSARFTINRMYSRVCGRVYAIQKGTPNAFNASVAGANPGLNGAYLDGVSLTHGPPGTRQHIWSFAAAIYETDPSYERNYVCTCTNTNFNLPYRVPSFVGEDYFCATANPGPGYSANTFFKDDPLWDGEGCGPTNACCQFNHPPWFCKTLPQTTSDDLELRLCGDQEKSNEDIIVTFLDIYVR